MASKTKKTKRKKKSGVKWNLSRSPRRPKKRAGGSRPVEIASALYREERFQEAEAAYRTVLDTDPDNPVILHILGILAHKAGRQKEAADFIHRAIGINPNVAEYHINLGNVLISQGKAEAAVDSFRKGLELDPGYASGHNNLGAALKELGRTEEAKRSFQKAVKLAPGQTEALFNLGSIADESGNYERAIAWYEKTIQFNPCYAAAYVRMGHLLTFHMRRPMEGLQALRSALRLDPFLLTARQDLIHALNITVFSAKSATDIPAALEQLLKDCFNSPETEDQRLSRSAAAFLRIKYQVEAYHSHEELLNLSHKMRADDLFIQFMEKTFNVDSKLETALAKIRKALLLEHFEKNRATESDKMLFAAFACQCFTNEYIFPVDNDEINLVEQLNNDIEEAIRSNERELSKLEKNIFLSAMYMPAYKLPCARELNAIPLEAWAPALRPIIQRSLYEPLEEETIKKKIKSISGIRDTTSTTVQAQYEDNPYPRWVSLPCMPSRNFKTAFLESFPGTIFPPFFKEPTQILVAGCGTGYQPIEIAQRFSNTQILAIDLSRSSLAYATRMAEEMEVRNIEFGQADILGLSSLERHFDVIYCVGVLHHMENPEKGWSVLNDLLIPGGFMRIGLYSEKARQAVKYFREEIRAKKIHSTPEDIRAFRMKLMNDQSHPELATLTRIPDFFTMSSCRDFLFHSMEHRFDLLQIKNILKKQGMTFVGFDLDSSIIGEEYLKHFPDDTNMTNLDNWNSYEEKYPDIFWGMYKFWCQKK